MESSKGIETSEGGLVELSDRRVMKSSNGKMEELSNRRLVEWWKKWSGGDADLSDSRVVEWLSLRIFVS